MFVTALGFLDSIRCPNHMCAWLHAFVGACVHNGVPRMTHIYPGSVLGLVTNTEVH